jgi:hypothetical protein
VTKGAVISPCGSYRYVLTRTWDEGLLPACFIGLNPSVADATVDDPTIRRMVGFARGWGCGGIRVVNLFAFRATDPKAMRAAWDPVGPDNDWVLSEASRECSPLVAAWGVHGTFRARDEAVKGILRDAGVSLRCLGLTKGGYPKHPLYLKTETSLLPYA